MTKSLLLILVAFWSLNSFSFEPVEYPASWWAPVDRDSAASWEVLPQDAREGEVILSKRNELGILSNFAATPFVFDGLRFESLEGFWQMMKFPENDQDERALFPNLSWPFTRHQVSQMIGFEAKNAGKIGSQNMKVMDINWVTYDGRRMSYRTPQKGEHYKLIVRAMLAKLNQNPRVKEILLKTGNLKLRPDHHQAQDASAAWKYHEIWMKIRKDLINE